MAERATKTKTKRGDMIRDTASKIRSAMAETSDAQSVVMSLYKNDVEGKNFHKKAFKQAVGLSKLEPAQFADHWTQLEEYLGELGCFDQMPLPLDQKAAAPSAAAAAPPAEKPKTEKPKAEKKVATKPATEEDFGSEAPRLAGKKAGLEGLGRDANPYPENSIVAQQWDAGWTEGHQEKVDAAAKANPDNVRPIRKRQLTEEGDVSIPPGAAAGAAAASLVSAELAGLPN